MWGKANRFLAGHLIFVSKNTTACYALVYKKNASKSNCFDFYYFIVEKYLTFRSISDTQVYSHVTLQKNIFFPMS